jgi:hypothetical protein
MIPYEELVTALARWRARRGLPTGLGDYLGEPAQPAPAYDAQTAVAEHGPDDVVEIGDELLDGAIEEPPAYDYESDAGMRPTGVPPDAPESGFRQAARWGDPLDARGADDEALGTPLASELDDVAAIEVEPVPTGPAPEARGRSRGGGKRRRR